MIRKLSVHFLSREDEIEKTKNKKMKRGDEIEKAKNNRR